MKNIIAVGGQGFLKECIYYLSLTDGVTFKGVLGVDGFVPQIPQIETLYLGSLEDYTICEGDYFIICTGNVELRQQIFEKIKTKGGSFYTLLYKTQVNPTVKYGEGNIFINCTLTVDIEIGKCNLFNNQTLIGHDVKIGDFNFIAPNVQILGGVSIEHFNSIGTSSILLPKCKIGRNNIIAPLSAIYKGCKNNCYIMGNPAQKVGNKE